MVFSRFGEGEEGSGLMTPESIASEIHGLKIQMENGRKISPISGALRGGSKYVPGGKLKPL